METQADEIRAKYALEKHTVVELTDEERALVEAEKIVELPDEEQAVPKIVDITDEVDQTEPTDEDQAVSPTDEEQTSAQEAKTNSPLTLAEKRVLLDAAAKRSRSDEQRESLRMLDTLFNCSKSFETGFCVLFRIREIQIEERLMPDLRLECLW